MVNSLTLAARVQQSRLNSYITRKLRTLLTEMNSDLIRIDFKIDLSADTDCANFNRVAKELAGTRHMNDAIVKLAEMKIKIRSMPLSEAAAKHVTSRLPKGFAHVEELDGQYCVVIDDAARLNRSNQLMLTHLEQQIDPTTVTMIAETAAATFGKENAQSSLAIGVIERKLCAVSQLAKTHEINVGHALAERATPAGFYLVRHAIPDVLRMLSKRTPFGVIFTAGNQIVNDILFARRWQAGRTQLEEAQFNIAERCNTYEKLYQMLYLMLTKEMGEKMQRLQETATDGTVSPEDEKLRREIATLSKHITAAKSETENLIRETRQEAARVNAKQQALSTRKHINRIFNIVMIGLGIGSFFFPPLAFPAIALSLAKIFTEKKLADHIQSAVQLVQGIYDIDNNIVISQDDNKQAFKKMRQVKEIVLQYSPPMVAAFKSGFTKKTRLENNAKLIREHAEYALYIPDALRYKQLDSYARRREIRGQIDAYSNTCNQLLFHLNMILNQHDNHPPDIDNIDKYLDTINEWSNNLLKQIRGQQLSPQMGKNSYFSDAQMSNIAKLRNRVKQDIQRYQEMRENPSDKAKKDLDFLKKMEQSITVEMNKLNEAFLNKTLEQDIINATGIIQRLENRVNILEQRCKQYNPDKFYEQLFQGWIVKLRLEIKSLNERLSVNEPENFALEEHIRHALKPPETSEITLNVAGSHEKLIEISIHHYRPFESRVKLNTQISREVARQATAKDRKTLHLWPVDKVTPAVLYQANYTKNILIIRGINRALEFIENTLAGKTTSGSNVTLANKTELLDNYKQQLQTIKDCYSHLSELKRKSIDAKIDTALDKIAQLGQQSTNQLEPPKNPTPESKN